MNNDKIHIPPIKIQGIKTKIVPLIAQMAIVDEDTTWYEPFMGSGVVGFNIAMKNAVFADSNPHIINFYNDIKKGEITSQIVREYLEKEGKKLVESEGEYYYKVRERFNKDHNSLDFLFLNRSCFNGMIRFNRKFEFNVPFCKKNNRFSKSYITKICNQIVYIEEKIKNNNWVFKNQSFEKTIKEAKKGDFIYCDPPYLGRHVDYFDCWDEELEKQLNEELLKTEAKFIVSTWDHNKYRKNEYIDSLWSMCYKYNKEHFYHVGAKQKNRNIMIEALLLNYKIED